MDNKIKIVLLIVICLIAVILAKTFLSFGQLNNNLSDNQAQPVESGDINYTLALGQSFIIGFDDVSLDEQTMAVLDMIKPAGIVLYRRNIANLNQLKGLIVQLQELAIKESGLPYLIMLDEEPSGATRLDLLNNVFSGGWPDWQAISAGIGVLADVGINVDLAPVADFAFNDNSFIKRRVPVDQAQDLMSFNDSFIDLLHQHDLLATLKHFPGLGVFSVDPHKDIPRLTVEPAVFAKSLEIFKKGIDSGADFVMTGHAFYQNIDSRNIATASKKIVSDILKDQLGFEGLVVTDDLADMPLSDGTVEDRAEIAIQALKAGHHLVMFSHRPERTKQIFDLMLERVKEDPDFARLLLENYQKIVQFKNEMLSFGKNLPRVCFKESCFQVEIADSPEERANGLMFRESLAENKGMLFIFEKEGLYSFWLKNTLIPLDIIWIDNDLTVVFIKENAGPCAAQDSCQSIVPSAKAHYVLELNSGAVDKLGLTIGDKFIFR